METIRSYLDNMFRAIPHTPETARLRADLLANMEDKYNELKAQGRTENEAVGIVISEFGNIDELLAELNLQSESAFGDAGQPFGRTLGRNEVLGFLDARRRMALLIAAGVFLCILSPAAFLALEAVTAPVQGNVMHVLAAAAFLFLVAAGVGLFIYAHFLGAPYRYLQTEPFTLEPDSHSLVEGRFQAQRGRMVLMTIAGVIILLMSPAVFMLFSAVGRPSVSVATGIGAAVALFMAAIAVFGFCHAGIVNSGYRILLQQNGYAPRFKRQDNRIIGAVASVWWPLSVCIYLGWSFLTGHWGTTWIIWPVSALLFGAFSGAYTILTGQDKADM